MQKIFKTFAFTLLFAITIALASSTQTQAATYSINPSSGSYKQECNNMVDIRIDTQGSPSNAADILVTYDTTKIDIIDQNSSEAGVQIKPGNVYQTYVGNVVNTTTGEIRLTGMSFTGSFNGSGTFAQIGFKSKAGVTSAGFTIYFTGADPYNSLDSNIADTNTSNDLLSSVTNATYTFTTGSCVADTQGPTITFLSPTNNQTGVPATANISVRITDNASGVDISTVEVVINGVTYTTASSGFSYTGTTLNYNVIVDPNELLNTTSANVVTVRATDMAGNSRENSIMFNIPTVPVIPPVTDTDSPTITFVTPTDKQEIPLDSNITFKVADVGDGININSLKVILNGVVYTAASGQVSYTGSKAEYTVTLNPDGDLPNTVTNTLVVYVADEANNGVVQSINFNIREGQIIIPPECPIIDCDPKSCPTTTVTIIKEITSATDQISDTLDPIFGNLEPNQVNNASAVTTAGAVLLGLGAVGISLAQIPAMILFGLFNLLTALGLRKKAKPYGYIYDATTKEPLQNAVVRVYNSENKLVATDVTDVYGIFRVELEAGNYEIKVSRAGYLFPSKRLEAKIDPPFGNIYTGGLFNSRATDSLSMAIPMDKFMPTMSDNVRYFFRFIGKTLWSLAVFAVIAFGFLINIRALAESNFGLLQIVLFILYLLTAIYLMRNLFRGDLRKGVIVNDNGLKMPNMTISILDANYNKPVGMVKSDLDGRYRMILAPNKYKFNVIGEGHKIVSGLPRDTFDLSNKKGPTIINHRIVIE